MKPSFIVEPLNVEPVWDGAPKMVKPIYFPYTYVPRWVAETLAACFKQFTVYQPSGRKLPAEMQPWVEANVMEVRVPVQTEDEALAKVVKDFRAFARNYPLRCSPGSKQM
jgi:predicted AlkP superfamily phosphohydrolase/phosphomutase